MPTYDGSTLAEPHPLYGPIPAPVPPTPLSADVMACAEYIARDMLDRCAELHEDTTTLYMLVRDAMRRPSYVNVDCPTIDDESISAGIVRALNDDRFRPRCSRA